MLGFGFIIAAGVTGGVFQAQLNNNLQSRTESLEATTFDLSASSRVNNNLQSRIELLEAATFNLSASRIARLVSTFESLQENESLSKIESLLENTQGMKV